MVLPPLPVLLATAVAAAGSTELVVRIDDQRARNLAQPWVVLVGPEGETTAVMALDDGTDPVDAYARDHLWVARVTLDEPLPTELVVRDGAPAAMAPLVRRLPLHLVAGERNEVQVRVRTAVGRPAAERPPVASAREEPPSSARDGAPPSAEGSPTPAASAAPLLDDEALVEPARVELAPWPRWLLAAWGLPLLAGAALRFGLPRTARLVEARLAGLLDLLDDLAAPLPRDAAPARASDEAPGAATRRRRDAPSPVG